MGTREENRRTKRTESMTWVCMAHIKCSLAPKAPMDVVKEVREYPITTDIEWLISSLPSSIPPRSRRENTYFRQCTAFGEKEWLSEEEALKWFPIVSDNQFIWVKEA